MVSALLLVCCSTSSPIWGERSSQEKPAPQTSVPPRATVKGDAMKKQLIHKVNPPYPREAMDNRIAGVVKVHVVIGVDGGVMQVEYLSGPAIFVQPTLNAVRQWKYKPQTSNGQPVEVDTTVDVVFSLNI
jgi:protein TonB